MDDKPNPTVLYVLITLGLLWPFICASLLSLFDIMDFKEALKSVTCFSFICFVIVLYILRRASK